MAKASRYGPASFALFICLMVICSFLSWQPLFGFRFECVPYEDTTFSRAIAPTAALPSCFDSCPSDVLVASPLALLLSRVTAPRAPRWRTLARLIRERPYILTCIRALRRGICRLTTAIMGHFPITSQADKGALHREMWPGGANMPSQLELRFVDWLE